MKPRVMSLVLFTSFVGLVIAPTSVEFDQSFFALLAVAIGAGAAGTLNMWYESDIDAVMSRTCLRPIPTGMISKKQALFFGTALSLISIVMLYQFSNFLSAALLALTIGFYFFVYTINNTKINNNKEQQATRQQGMLLYVNTLGLLDYYTSTN